MAQINVAVNPAVPDAYIEIIPPNVALLEGVPTDKVGLVGTASWGPVDAPTPVNANTYASVFGPLKARAYDLGTHIATAGLAGANDFTAVRVTDGTDVAASALIGIVGTPTKVAGGTGFAANDTVNFSNGAVLTVLTVTGGAIATVSVLTQPTAETAGTLNQTSTSGAGTGAEFSFAYVAGLTATSKYTGSLANDDTIALSAGSQASTTTATITRAGLTPEVFPNIGGSGATFWENLAAAINSGVSGLRGPSNLIVATQGASTAAPVNGSTPLAGGVDGVATITSAVLVGSDTGTRTGMYALRGIGPAILDLCDCSDYTTFPAQIALALSEGFYAIGVGPSGEYTGLSTVAANLQAVGISGAQGYAMKVLVGDWVYFLDTVNGGVPRLVSPQGFVAGLLASLDPFESGLNKQIVGITATQKSAANQTYAEPDLTTIGQNCLDIVTNPCPGGNFFGLRFGKNASPLQTIWGDNYSRMIPYLAYSFNQVAGQFVGQVITKDQANDAVACFVDFLAGLASASPTPWISNPQGTIPYSVAIDLSRASAGYEIVNISVQLGPILLQFVINLQAGQTVQIAVAAA